MGDDERDFVAGAEQSLARDLAQLRFKEPRFSEVFSVPTGNPARRRVLAVAAGFALILVASIGVAAATGLIKLPADPWAGLTDAQRQGQVDRAHIDAAAFVEQFMASGRDLRSLPRRHESSFAGLPADLPTALSEASVVLIGTVQSVEITPAEGLPRATVSIVVERWIRGGAGQQIEILQSGGPAQAADGSAELVDLEAAPLLLPGDRVALIAQRLVSGEFAGELTPQHGTGIVYFVNAKAQPVSLSPADDLLRGLTEPEVIAVYEAGGR